MNQIAKSRVLKLLQIACYLALAWYLLTSWRDFLGLAAGIASHILVFGLLLVALAALAVLLLAFVFGAEKILKFLSRHD